MSNRNLIRTVLAAFFVAAALAGPGRAHAEDAAAPAGAASAVKGEMLFWIQDADGKLMELAEAIPEGKYGWSPDKGVRTVGQVFMHVAGANFGIPTFFGVAPPAGFNFATFEDSLTKKADIKKALKDSFTHMENAVKALSDADLNKPVNLFGTKTTVRGACLLLLSHAHEHLGQAIAYARSNKVTPPWTAREQAAAEAAKKQSK